MRVDEHGEISRVFYLTRLWFGFWFLLRGLLLSPKRFEKYISFLTLENCFLKMAKILAIKKNRLIFENDQFLRRNFWNKRDFDFGHSDWVTISFDLISKKSWHGKSLNSILWKLFNYFPKHLVRNIISLLRKFFLDSKILIWVLSIFFGFTFRLLTWKKNILKLFFKNFFGLEN